MNTILKITNIRH